MADLGAISKSGTGAYPMPDQAPRTVLRLCSVGESRQVFGARDDVEGNPATPCLRLDARGVWRFRWRVRAGSRSIQVNVKQAINLSPRPTLTVKANPAIGIAADVSATAGSSAGWIVLGPVAVTPTIDGATWVELRSNYDAQYLAAPCYFDHIVTL